MTDICKTCKSVFPISELMKDSQRSKGYRNKCLRCLAASRGREYNPKARRRNHCGSTAEKKRFLDSLRSVPCTDCGQKFLPCAMDFDHVGPKSFGIMNKYRDKTMEQLKQEVAKCEVVCANCHRVRTYNRR